MIYMQKKLDYDYCPAAPLLEWLGNKWALAVFITVCEAGTLRFHELARAVPSISEKMLANALRSLVTDGLLCRHIYPEVPPRVEYSVSELGRSLYPGLATLLQWGREHYATILANRNREKG